MMLNYRGMRAVLDSNGFTDVLLLMDDAETPNLSSPFHLVYYATIGGSRTSYEIEIWQLKALVLTSRMDGDASKLLVAARSLKERAEQDALTYHTAAEVARALGG